MYIYRGKKRGEQNGLDCNFDYRIGSAYYRRLYSHACNHHAYRAPRGVGDAQVDGEQCLGKAEEAEGIQCKAACRGHDLGESGGILQQCGRDKLRSYGECEKKIGHAVTP